MCHICIYCYMCMNYCICISYYIITHVPSFLIYYLCLPDIIIVIILFIWTSFSAAKSRRKMPRPPFVAKQTVLWHKANVTHLSHYHSGFCASLMRATRRQPVPLPCHLLFISPAQYRNHRQSLSTRWWDHLSELTLNMGSALPMFIYPSTH